MSDLKTFRGHCHCGAVQYDVITDLSRTITCDCSMCGMMNWVLTFVPAEQFTLISGEDQQIDYQFNKKVIHHLFCKTCGIHSFGRGTDAEGKATYAINVLCLDGVDIKTLTPTHYNGKDV